MSYYRVTWFCFNSPVACMCTFSILKYTKWVTKKYCVTGNTFLLTDYKNKHTCMQYIIMAKIAKRVNFKYSFGSCVKIQTNV